MYPLGANLILEKVGEPFHPVIHLFLAPGTAEKDAAASFDDGKECTVVEFLMRVLAFRVFANPIFHLDDTLLDASVHCFASVFEGVAVRDLFGEFLLVSSEFLCVVENESVLVRPVMMGIVGTARKGTVIR